MVGRAGLEPAVSGLLRPMFFPWATARCAGSAPPALGGAIQTFFRWRQMRCQGVPWPTFRSGVLARYLMAAVSLFSRGCCFRLGWLLVHAGGHDDDDGGNQYAQGCAQGDGAGPNGGFGPGMSERGGIYDEIDSYEFLIVPGYRWLLQRLVAPLLVGGVHAPVGDWFTALEPVSRPVFDFFSSVVFRLACYCSPGGRPLEWDMSPGRWPGFRLVPS